MSLFFRKRNLVLVALAFLFSAPAFCQYQAQYDPRLTLGQPGQDENFMGNILEDGNAAVLLSKLGTEKASSPDVKALAQKIMDTQAAIGKQMSSDAAMTGTKLPQGLNKKYKKVEEKLNGLSGDAFDKEYVSAMVKLHHEMIGELRGEINNSHNASLQGDAQGAVQQCEMLADQIKAMNQKMGGH
jgi:putative membrane protein